MIDSDEGRKNLFRTEIQRAERTRGQKSLPNFRDDGEGVGKSRNHHPLWGKINRKIECGISFSKIVLSPNKYLDFGQNLKNFLTLDSFFSFNFSLK